MWTFSLLMMKKLNVTNMGMSEWVVFVGDRFSVVYCMVRAPFSIDPDGRISKRAVKFQPNRRKFFPLFGQRKRLAIPKNMPRDVGPSWASIRTSSLGRASANQTIMWKLYVNPRTSVIIPCCLRRIKSRICKVQDLCSREGVRRDPPNRLDHFGASNQSQTRQFLWRMLLWRGLIAKPGKVDDW